MGDKLTTSHRENLQKGGNGTDLMADFCKHLSKSLDLIGYSQEMICFRRETNKLMDVIHNEKPFSVMYITNGGKAEGTALYFESDIDRLYVVKGVACVEPGMECSSPSVIYIDKSSCSPGYARLKLIQLSETDNILQKYLVKERHGLYVANSYSIFNENAYMIDINGTRITKQDKSGPSVPYGNNSIKYDFVFGFQCYCPVLIKKWTKRPRYHGWPDPKLVEHISNLEGHVVPVANKGSRFPQTEWRICFTKAELLLMHSFTELQTKLYILLKLIAKCVLRPLCSEMSSYIMKNVMFWMIENNPMEKFLELYLIERLTDAVLYLKECLHSKTLKSYMIAERNLFEGRIPEDEREALLKVLDELLSEQENMLQRCSKIRLAMSKLKESPEEFSKEAANRDKIEKLVYKKNIIFKENENDGPDRTVEALQECLNRNEVYMQYEKELHSLVISDKLDLNEQNFEDVYRERLSNILS